MSRGPGVAQREILSTLEQVGAFYLADLAGGESTSARYKSLYRAAYQLEASGKISLTRYLCGGGLNGGNKLAVSPPNSTVLDRSTLKNKLSAEALTSRQPFNT